VAQIPVHETGPVRTCVGCRKTEPAEALVRLALGPGGQVAVDHPRKLGGRGTWLHATGRCVREALKRGAIARGLGCARVAVTAEELADAMRARFLDRARSLLSSARRSGNADVGTTAVVGAVRDGRATLLVFAEDAAASALEVREALRGSPAEVPEVRFGTKEELGALWSRDVLGVVAVTDTGLGESIARELERATWVLEGLVQHRP